MRTTTLKNSQLGQAGLRLLVGWSALLFAARILGAAATYATQVAIARWFGADVLGQYVLAFSVLLITSLIATCGFVEAAPRFIGLAMNQDNRGMMRGYIRRARQVSLLGGLMVSSVGAVMTWLFVSQPYQLAIWVALAVMPAYGLVRLNCSFAQGFARLALRELPNSVVRPTLFLLGVVLCWKLSVDTSSATLMIMHASIIAIVMAFLTWQISKTSRKLAGTAIPIYDDKLWFSVVPSLAVTGAFYMYLPEIVNLIVSYFLDATDIAHLNSAMRTGMLVMFVVHAIDSALLPRATHLLSTKSMNELESWVLRSAMLKILATGIAIIVFLILGEKILGLFGEGFRSAAPALYIFASGFFLRVLIAPPLQVMILASQQAACVRASLASLFVLVSGVVILVPSWGSIGASLSAVLSMLAWGFVLTGPAKAALGFHPAPLSWVVSRLFSGVR